MKIISGYVALPPCHLIAEFGPNKNVPKVTSTECFKVQKGVAFLAILFSSFFLFNNSTYSQNQIIGSFPNMQGGIENQTLGIVPVGLANYPSGATVTTYSRNNNASGPPVVEILSTGGNSGPKCFSWSNSSTSAAVFTPTLGTDVVLSNTSYVVQFFAKKGTSTANRNFSVRVYTDGANFTEVATTQIGNSTYQKFTAIITSPNDPLLSGKTGYVGIKPKGGSFGTGLTYLFDDFCMYPGTTVDETAPDPATSPYISSYTSTSLNVNWSAPSTGLDGGGYVVVRYSINPASEPAPVANGIYALGNTIGNGTVVYIGTGTNFNDVGLSSSSTYYYKIFVADKAFNYSINPPTVAGYTGISGPTLLTFTTPAGCLTDRIVLSWNGPLNYNAGTNTQLAFLKSGSAVTPGTPTLTPSAYTPSTNFASPGTNYQNDANAKCIYNGDGTDASGNHSGLTITGLTANTTYYVLLYNVIDNIPTYSGGVSALGTTLASAAPEPTNHPTAFAKGIVSTTNIAPTWTAAVAGTQAPLGYLLQISNSATPADPTDAVDPANQTNVSAGTGNFKITPNSTTTYSGFTGLTAGTMYNFRINSYTNTASCINFKAAGPTINAATLPNAVSSPSLAISGTTGTITWTLPADYNSANHSTLVFVKASATAITAGNPTNNPSGYTANTTVLLGTAYQLDASAFCVYKGDASSVNITGLTGGSTYQVLILTVVDAPNSDVTNSYSAYATASATTGAIYTWQGGATGTYTTTTNWNPTRTTPLSTDVLVFNTGGSVTPASIISETIAKLVVTNNTSLSLRTASRIFTITSNNGILNSDLIIDAGSTITLGAPPVAPFSIILSANSSSSIAGSLIVTLGSTYNTNAAGCMTTVSGVLKSSGTVTCAAANMLVTNTGTYEHATNGGTIPNATWNTGSTCLISGIVAATSFTGSGHAQTFSKLVWDCATQTAAPFVLGVGTSNASPCVIADSFIVRRTGSGFLQLTSTGGQNDFTCGNYFQYGGKVAITYNTDNAGTQRSLTVNNTFYVTDSLVSNTFFQVINNPGSTTNIAGRLFVKGNIDMRTRILNTTLEAFKDNSSNPSIAEIVFNGTSAQNVKFSTISGNIDFINNNSSASGVTLQSNVTASKFKFTRGAFYIGPNTLTINDSVSYPLPGTGTLGSMESSNLIMGRAGIAGTLNFTPGFRVIKDFTQLAGNTTALGTDLSIVAGTNPGRDSLGIGATLITNDNLILKSDANGTARIAKLTANGSGIYPTISGKVTIERYLPMTLSPDGRRWRLLSSPLKATNAPTINAAWQAGASNPDRFNPASFDPRPGYGTHITKSSIWTTNGYDQGSTTSPSLYYFSNGSWVAPANTNVTKITDNGGCYMLFARGDRSIVISNTLVNAIPTTLDPKGELNIGDVTIPMVASGFQAVGNPYASAIKLDGINFNDTLGNRKTIYLWDPKLVGSFGVGKFVTCSGDGNGNYTYSANVSNYGGNPGVIESSGAFMVKGNGGNIVFHESDKVIRSSTIGLASRPSSPAPIQGNISKLFVDVSTIKNGQSLLVDGAASCFSNGYSNEVDGFDAAKFSSFTTKEAISIKRNNQYFSIERRKKIIKTDTIFLNIAKFAAGSFQFSIRPENFESGISGYLKDNYTGNISSINLLQSTSIPFEITNDSMSFNENRFYIFFKRNTADDIIPGKSPIIPGQIFSEHSTCDTLNQLSYFNKRLIGNNGSELNIKVYPNPVNGKLFSLKMNNFVAGIYLCSIFDNDGKILHTQNIIFQPNVENHQINITNPIAAGQYNLKLYKENTFVKSVPLIIK